MEDYEEFYKTICRVCLSQSKCENMVSLTDTSSEDGLTFYGKAVVTFANILIKTDSLPNKMCQNCLFFLKQAIVFKKTCEKSDERLTKLVRKFDVTQSDFKEKVSQYVLFTHYFPRGCPEKTSIMPMKLQDKVNCSRKTEKIVKNEFYATTDVENDLDDFFADSFQNDIDPVENERNDNSDIDEILEKIENVIEMKPESLNVYRKKYKQNKVKTRQIRSLKRKKQKFLNIPQDTETNLQCIVCNKVLANIKTFKFHMQRHNGCRYVCEHCAKTYPTHAELQYHLASTHDIGPHFICKECGYKAPRRYDLREHERVHTGERPFKCDKCGLTFRRRFIWKKHALYHMEKSVQCPQCPRKFYQRSEMLAHANNVHERVYIYACNECDVTYARPATVRRHLIEKHGVAREMQGRIRRVNIGKSSIR